MGMWMKIFLSETSNLLECKQYMNIQVSNSGSCESLVAFNDIEENYANTWKLRSDAQH